MIPARDPKQKNFLKFGETTKGTTGSHLDLSAISSCHSWIYICSHDDDDDDDDDENNSEDDSVDDEASISIKVMSRNCWSYVCIQLAQNGHNFKIPKCQYSVFQDLRVPGFHLESAWT